MLWGHSKHYRIQGINYNSMRYWIDSSKLWIKWETIFILATCKHLRLREKALTVRRIFVFFIPDIWCVWINCSINIWQFSARLICQSSGMVKGHINMLYHYYVFSDFLVLSFVDNVGVIRVTLIIVFCLLIFWSPVTSFIFTLLRESIFFLIGGTG